MIEGEKGNGKVFGDDAEEGRHGEKACIGKRHLHADDGLGSILAENVGGHMDDAGVDGCAAETYGNKPDQR